MLGLIFEVLSIIIWLVVLFYGVCFVFGVALGLVQIVLRSKIFWGALIGGLIAYNFVSPAETTIIDGMIVGGCIVLFAGLISICWSKVTQKKVKKVLGWTLGGFVIGIFCGFSILFGIIGLGIGIYKVS